MLPPRQRARTRDALPLGKLPDRQATLLPPLHAVAPNLRLRLGRSSCHPSSLPRAEIRMLAMSGHDGVHRTVTLFATVCRGKRAGLPSRIQAWMSNSLPSRQTERFEFPRWSLPGVQPPRPLASNNRSGAPAPGKATAAFLRAAWRVPSSAAACSPTGTASSRPAITNSPPNSSRACITAALAFARARENWLRRFSERGSRPSKPELRATGDDVRDMARDKPCP
jgi:hypothetical protein